MKILMVTMGLDIGGAETHIVELSKELKQQGHEVCIVSNGGVYEAEVNAAGIRHYKAPLNRRSVGAMKEGKKILRQVIEQEKPDVVHAHARIPGFLCGQLQKKMGFAFVTSCHGIYNTSGPLRLLTDWGERTLAVSEDVRDYLMKEYNIPAEHITVTINGIDTRKFSPEISGEKVRRELALGDSPVLAHVCRLDAFTAPPARQLIALAPRLSQAVPGLRIVIVGGGEVYEELKARAAEVNSQLGRECLTLTGPRTDINELVAACDVFTGVSRAALEAMSEEKPVVLSGAQGHMGLFYPEMLERAVDTNFCCRTDPVATDEQFYQALTAALTLPAGEKERLGKNGRQVVKEYYSVGRMAQDSLNMYRQVRRRKYNVLMSGYYGFCNAGDDAIMESIRDAVQDSTDEVKLTVLSNDPEETSRHYGMDAVSRFRMSAVMAALKKSDMLLFGGGSLLQDATSTRSLLYYLSVIRMAHHLHKPVMLYANGIGPVKQAENRRRVIKVVEKVDLITLRDHGSANELKNMGVTGPRVKVTADPVFYMAPAPEERALELLEHAGVKQGENFIAVSVRNWPETEKFVQELAVTCDYIARNRGLKILFIMMQPNKDRSATEKVRAAMKETSYLVDEPCTPRETMAVLGKARMCLAMRLHVLIFAARMAVPSLGLVYDPKVAGYLNELELPSAGNVKSFDSGYAIRQVESMMNDYDKVLVRLKEKSAQLTRMARENEKLMLDLLHNFKQ